MSDLESIRGIIDAALGKWGVGQVGAFVKLSENWREIAGEQWAEHTKPVLLRRAVLTVEASPAAASILRYAVGDLLRALDRELGRGEVTEIRIRLTGQGRSTV
ncbi:MAG: DUF721 domain-containing protein [Gammaproteobacteria bacterium]|nr:DUF721 domain-containing protein [Gammaproteobacteria bacterium]